MRERAKIDDRRRSSENPRIFWPILCSPTATEQMQVLLGSYDNLEKNANFIQKLFSGSENKSVGDVWIKVFNFENHVIFVSVFTTDAIEPGSKRKGLKIAIGFGVDDPSYLDDGRLPLALWKSVSQLINDRFALKLPSAGARQLIEQFVAGEGFEQLNLIQRELQHAAAIVATLRPIRLGAIGRAFRTWLWRFRHILRPPPKCLLLLDDRNGEMVTAAFDALLFEYINRRRRIKLNANVLGAGDRADILVRYLDLGVSQVKKSALVRTRNQSYVALY